jgi:hypothetical protein
LFDDDIHIDYPNEEVYTDDIFEGLPTDMWIPAYYVDILIGQERNTLAVYEPDLLIGEGETGLPWYETAITDLTTIENGKFIFYNAAIYIGHGRGFLIKNITKTIYGYMVTCMESKNNLNMIDFEGPVNWDFSNYEDLNTLYLHIDGDYLEMFINQENQLFGKAVRVKKEFIEEYQRLMKTGVCDLANVIWPRRADGSMDYPLPDMSGFRATHITTDRLRLRTAPDILAQAVTTLEKGTEVQVLETGEETVIDGIRAPWVKVLDGTTGCKGWCFR